MTHEPHADFEQESKISSQSNGDVTEESQLKSPEEVEGRKQMLVAREIMRRYADTLKRLADS